MTTHLKFDGPHLEEVLERVGRELGPDAVILEANRTRRGGVGGFFAREWFEVVVAARALADDADDSAAASRSIGSAASAVDGAALLAMADAVEDRVEPRELDAADTFAGVLARVGGGLGEAGPAVASDAAPTGHRGHGLRPPAAAPDPTPVTVPVPLDVPRPAAPTPARPAVAAPAARRLRDLALPEMLAHLDRLVPTATLPAVAAPIVAVVGDLTVGRSVAAGLAARLGLGDADVVVATASPQDAVPAWMLVDGPGTARARVARWRRGEHPVVVAVDLTPGRDGHAWAAEVLAALDADQVRLVARAWQVTDELAAKAAILGGVDGLELVELDAAAEPEAFLELALPVLGLDGRAASSEMWAALLMERRNDAIA